MLSYCSKRFISFIQKTNAKKKWQASRYFIQAGGSLTGAKKQQKAQEHKQLQESFWQPQRPSRYSNCNQEGYNWLKYPNK